MPDDVKCVPGNPALPGKPIAITRVGGFGASSGSVKLIADGGDDDMPIVKWTSTAISATVPASAPGRPPYYVQVTANGQTYTGPVDVRRLTEDGSGYPPTHPPTH